MRYKIQEMIKDVLPSNRAYVVAILPVVILFGGMWASAHIGMQLAIGRGWEQTPIETGPAFIVAIVLTVLIGLALNNATIMRQEEQADIGIINHGFKELASYVSIDPKAFGVLEQLIDTGRHFLLGEAIDVYCRQVDPMKGSWDAVFNEMTRRAVNSVKMEPLAKELTTYIVKDIRSAFGRIETRRLHPIPASMYLVCALFSIITVFLLLVSAVTGAGELWMNLATALILLYGLAVVLILVYQHEGALGFEGNRISPEACFQTWQNAIADQYTRNQSLDYATVQALKKPTRLGEDDEEPPVLRLTIQLATG